MFHFTRQDSSLRWAAVIAGLSTFTACGGGGNNTTPPAAATRVVGVAATGAALAGASVTLIDADATTTDPAPQTTDGGGRYSFGVDGLKAPFALKVGYTQDGQAQTLYAVLGSADANADNTANITPLSHAVAALVAPGGDPAALEAPAALLAATTGAKAGALADAVATLVAVLGSDPAIRAALEAAAGSGASFDPVRTPFAADGSGIDAVLDQLTVSTNPPGAAAGTVQIQNNLQAVDGDAPAAPVHITPGTTPASAPTLPPTASGDLPTAADLDAFAAPSGVTGHGMHRDRMILRHQARGDQRAQQRDRAGRIAPGIGHPGRGRDPGGLRRLHLGKTVGPSGIGPMRRTGIDDPHLRPRDSGHGLARRRIGQTQDRDIAPVDGLRSPMRILAPPVGQGQQ